VKTLLGGVGGVGRDEKIESFQDVSTRVRSRFVHRSNEAGEKAVNRGGGLVDAYAYKDVTQGDGMS